jgi:predicted acyltransferase
MNQLANRFLALDLFRGITICFMIIVNTPGSGAEAFAPLNHASWHGFTPTDLVFPSFLFAVGNAMSFSMLKYKAIGDGAVLGKVFKRSILIFLIGYLMYWFPFFHLENGRVVLNSIGETRIMGVLQRIAVCYLLASLIIHFLSRQMVYVISALLLIGYWIILLVFGDPADPLSMTGNAGQYIDQYFLGDKHLYHGEGIPFDPEGLLSTLPAIVNVIIGYYAGHFVQRIGISYETIARLLLSGALLILLALSWDMVFPINKKLWTSSFVLLSTGLDLVILAGLIYVSDIKNYNKWNWTRFFLVFGRNALFIYVLSEILLVPLYMISIGDMSLYRWINHAFFQVIAAGSIGSLLFAISYMLFCWLVALILDRKKIYIRV